MNRIARDIADDDDSIVELFSRLVSDAQQVARAEIDLQKARLLAKIAELRGAVLLLLVAVMTASLALIALTIGALLILTAYLGPIWATVIVVVFLVGLAALCGWLSMQQLNAVLGVGEKDAGTAR